MRNCRYCKIKVGGKTDICPLCQSPLTGEPSEEHWPVLQSLKKMSFWGKMILFIMLSACVVCFWADFIVSRHPHRHWSIMVLSWIIVTLFMFAHLYKSRKGLPRFLTETTFVYSVLVFFTGWFWGFRGIVVDLIMPIVVCITLITNFILSFIKKDFAANALVCMLCNIVLGTLPYVALLLHRGVVPMAWAVSLMLSAITFIGLVIFQGSIVFKEIEKRLHM